MPTCPTASSMAPARRNTRLAKAPVSVHTRGRHALLFQSPPFPAHHRMRLIVYLLILLAHFCACPMTTHQLHLVMPGKISYKNGLCHHGRVHCMAGSLLRSSPSMAHRFGWLCLALMGLGVVATTPTSSSGTTWRSSPPSKPTCSRCSISGLASWRQRNWPPSSTTAASRCPSSARTGMRRPMPMAMISPP